MPHPWIGFLALPEALILALLAAALGRRIIRSLLPDAEPQDRAVLALPLGFAALSLGSTGLLFAGAFRLLPVLGLLAATLLVCRVEARESVAGAAGWLRRLSSAPLLERLFAALASVVVLFGVVGCLAPETGWDSGLYHFGMARIRADEGRLVVRQDVVAGFRPAALESLQALGYLLNGEALASLVNLLLYLSLVSLAWRFAGRAGGERAAALGGIAAFASVTYILRTCGGDVEAGQAVYFGVLILAMDRLREGPSLRWSALAGLAVGMMLSIKYSAAWGVIAAALSGAAIRIADRAGLGRTLREAGVAAVIALAVASPWYLRNWVVAGHPLYPQDFLVGAAVAGGYRSGGPWMGAMAQAAALDALAFAAIPLVLLRSGIRLRWAVGAALLYLALVLRHMGLPMAIASFRYASPGYLVLYALGGVGLDDLWRRFPTARWPAAAVFAVGVAGGIGLHVVRNVPKLSVAVGIESREDFLDRRINSYWAIRRAEAELPPGSKVLLAEARVLYCRAPFLGASDAQAEVRFDALRTPEALRHFFERHRIAFIVHNHSAVAQTHGFQTVVSTPGLLREAGATRVETRQDCTLYRVR